MGSEVDFGMDHLEPGVFTGLVMASAAIEGRQHDCSRSDWGR
jgi:hypothetical protein